VARNARASSLLWPWRIVKSSCWGGAEMVDRRSGEHRKPPRNWQPAIPTVQTCLQLHAAARWWGTCDRVYHKV